MDVADPEAIVPSGSVKRPVEERALGMRRWPKGVRRPPEKWASQALEKPTSPSARTACPYNRLVPRRRSPPPESAAPCRSDRMTVRVPDLGGEADPERAASAMCASPQGAVGGQSKRCLMRH
jgi:hypothetical protein